MAWKLWTNGTLAEVQSAIDAFDPATANSVEASQVTAAKTAATALVALVPTDRCALSMHGAAEPAREGTGFNGNHDCAVEVTSVP